ncbi:AMP-binding protein [Streptomyces sp. NPDC000070]|uniref:AMP-binding protein n=1 Tax=Streptomyces sp. NPDC000070 TaxID=3154240 RepID=UPI00331F934E
MTDSPANGRSVIVRLESTASLTPTATAVLENGVPHSYAEPRSDTEWPALDLHHRGVRPGDRVGVAVERSYWCVVAFLAALRVGGAYVPLHPAYPGDRLQAAKRIDVRGVMSGAQPMPSPVLPVPVGGTLVIDRRATDGSVMGLSAAVREHGVTITHTAELGGECGSSLSDGERVPIGRPLPHVHRVVKHGDPHTGIGELFIGGPALAAGYVGVQPQRHMVPPRPGLLPAEARAAAWLRGPTADELAAPLPEPGNRP